MTRTDKQQMIFVALIILACVLVYAGTRDQPALESALVTYVYDGDTIVVLMDGKEFDVRFSGVDAPERGTPEGERVYTIIKLAIDDGEVGLECYGKDKYDRMLCDVYFGQGNLGDWMVDRGLARVWR